MLQICSVSQKLEPRDPTGQTPLRIDNPIMDRIEKIIKHRPEFKSISPRFIFNISLVNFYD